ncbi:MAG: hypothetical protein GXP45_08255 [bacterium]|nr:hypothetical protein [bacterium]
MRYDLTQGKLLDFDKKKIREKNKGPGVDDLILKLTAITKANELLEVLSNYEKFDDLLSRLDKKNPYEQEIIRGIENKTVKHTVDIEESGLDDVIYILQCRPATNYSESDVKKDFDKVKPNNVLLDIKFKREEGYHSPSIIIPNIRYVLFVDGKDYHIICATQGGNVATEIGNYNRKLKDDNFIMIMPGRTGSQTNDEGVPVQFHQIMNTKALIEYPIKDKTIVPPNGPHMGNNLREKNIFWFYLPTDDIIPRGILDEYTIDSKMDGTIKLVEFPQELNVYSSRPENRLLIESKAVLKK